MTFGMSKTILRACVAVLIATSCGWSAAKPLVLVTTSDMAAIVQAVSGDLAEIGVVMPPGADPHAFTITAEQARSFQRAALVVYAHSEYHEFEQALKSGLASTPSLDWPDYAAHGAVLHDVPDYPRNPHGPWLYLPNARAMATAVAARLEEMGLPAPVLQGRLALFQQELAAQEQLCLRVARDAGLAGRPVLAVIPGVCDVIANFGLPVGDVLMAEGSGTVAGKRLEETVARLRSGQYAAVVCPLSMRQAKQGEAARQVARDSGAPVIYVHFLDAQPERDTYLSLVADNMAAFAGVHTPQAAQPGATPLQGGRLGMALLAGIAGLAIGLILSRVLARPRSCGRGAGIFDA
jgi:zinc/manganese transport system substrate-binding protein